MASGSYVREGEAAAHDPDSGEAGGGWSTPSCCPLYHRAVELIGRRWTGAILEILIQTSSLRFSQIASAVTDLSDRMLSDRLKELEAWGLVERTVHPGPPVRVEYALTRKGRELAPSSSSGLAPGSTASTVSSRAPPGQRRASSAATRRPSRATASAPAQGARRRADHLGCQ
jgi:DNA-binding HxlR family transcriptional regulator